MTKSILKEYIKLLVEKEAFGDYLFAPSRIDLKAKNVKEKNTKIEETIFDALMQHYAGNSSKLEKNIQTIISNKNHSDYKKFLMPENKPLYRLVFLDKNDLEANNISDESMSENKLAYFKSGGGTLKPHKKMLQSWTQSLTKNFIIDFLQGSDHVLLPKIGLAIFKVSGPKDNFILNPKNMSEYIDFGHSVINRFVSQEQEVISYGDVSYDSATVLFNGTDKSVDLKKHIGKLIK